MPYRFLVFFSLLLAISLQAADSKLPTKFSPQEEIWVLRGLSPAVVSETLFRYANEFADGVNNRPLSPTAAMLSLGQLDNWSQYRYFECDTNFSRVWLLGIRKFFVALIDSRKKLRDLEQCGKKASREYKQWDEYYKTTAKQLQTVVTKPQKPRDKNVKDKGMTVQKLRKEKEKVVEILKKKQDKQ